MAATRDEATILAERVQAGGEEIATHVLVRQVRTGTVGDAHDLFDDVLLRVVDAVVHAELGRSLELVVTRRRADDAGTAHGGELHGGRANTRADRVDQHGLADRQATAREEHVERRAERDLRGGRIRVRETVGDAHEVALRDRAVLGVAAGTRDADEVIRGKVLAAGAGVDVVEVDAHQVRRDAITDLPLVGDSRANLDDLAGQLEAEHAARIDREARDALAEIDVEVVERARSHLDQHLVGQGLRGLDVLDDDLVDPTELMKQRCSHCSLLRLAVGEVSRPRTLWSNPTLRVGLRRRGRRSTCRHPRSA